jgi:methylmalonyl-CoA/ethylmalonyl-CoA epimerase
MNLDHVAIAVQDLEAAAYRLCSLLGYSRRTMPVTNSRQQVRVLFLRKSGSPDIKLIEPAGETSPLWPFVRRGGGLHHLCFKTPDVGGACDDLVARGARLLAAPQPGEAFDDELIAFLYLGLGLNVEVIDTDRRRSQIAEAD